MSDVVVTAFLIVTLAGVGAIMLIAFVLAPLVAGLFAGFGTVAR